MRWSATRMFSSTVRCGNTAEIWNERTTPRRATSAGRSEVMFSPLNLMVPADGVRNLVSRLKQVVFPAPFGPDQRVDGPGPHREAHVLHRDEPAEFLGQPLGLEERLTGVTR